MLHGPAGGGQGLFPAVDGIRGNKESFFCSIRKGREYEIPGKGSIGKEKGSIVGKGPVGTGIEEADQGNLHTDQAAMEEKAENTVIEAMAPDTVGGFFGIMGPLEPEGFPVIEGRDL